eukprot:g12940.t1
MDSRWFWCLLMALVRQIGHDQYLLISIHMDKENHYFDWDTTKILGQARQRQARDFLEAWHSTKHALNKHIELDPIYIPLRRRPG